VGRGALAGPIVTGVVVFPPQIKLEIAINDSKKMSPRNRAEADLWIRHNALVWALGTSSVKEINDIGIVPATQRAFRRAIMKANSKLLIVKSSKLSITYLLVDAFYIPYTKGLNKSHQLPIIKGDCKSLSIAAASVLAKVYRDKIMCDAKYNDPYPHYLWHQNKGYGTKAHREAIITHGITPHHRLAFVRKSFFSSQALSDT